MDYTILSPEVKTDPENFGYDSMDDDQVALEMNKRQRLIADPDNRKTLFDLIVQINDTTKTDDLINKLDTRAQASPTVAELMRALRDYSTEGGLKLGSPRMRQIIRDLQTASHITNEEKSFLLNTGQKRVSRATELGLPEVKPGHVTSARAMP